MGCCRPGRRFKPSACQQSHPACRGAGIFLAHIRRIKREPVFHRRWARHRIPLTTKGLQVAQRSLAKSGDPSRKASESAELAPGDPGRQFAEKRYLQVRGPGDGRAGRLNKRRRCAGRPAGRCGTWATPPMASTALEGTGSVKACGRTTCAGREHPRWTRRFRPAACLLQSG